jgi:hypothetical integral membrane protein (TIGR02206 family)
VPLAAFETFGGQHLLVLGVFVLGLVVVVLLGRGRRGLDRLDRPGRLDRVLAVVLVVVALSAQAFQLTPGDFDLGSSLPLALCDFAWVAAAWALWTRRRLPAAVTYYWGLTLTIQGILTPSLGQDFPHPRFFAFWALHLLVVWAAAYLSLGLGIGPGWREYRWTVAISLVWAVVAYTFDVAFDVNYGYLVEKPGSGSLLDLFGPWPVYVLVALAVLLVGWALMTWPWVALRDAQRTHGRAGS